MDYRSEATYKESRLPVELASTLIADAYRSQDFFADERDQLFTHGWVVVGALSEVSDPGQVIARQVGGRSIIITRNKDHELRAFLNVCRHRGTQLLTKDTVLRAGRIRCPYHAWAYDLDGTCIGTPLFEGSDIPDDMRAAFDMANVKAFDKADYPLFVVKVGTWGPLIVVSLDPDVMPLADWLGDLPDRLGGYYLENLEGQTHKDYDIGANWKLIAENFMEYYHLPWVHPELAKVSRVEDHYRYQGPGMYTGMTTTPISGDNPAWLALPPHAGVIGSNLNAGRFMLLFPNAAIALLPNHLFLMILEPVSVDRTLERTLTLTHPETMQSSSAQEGLDYLMTFWDGVNVEDIEIVEAVQRGVSTPEYVGGRMCYRFEEPVHRFHNMVIDRMVGIDRIPEGDKVDMVPMFGE
jgi:choline monooxygenase